MDHPDGDRNLLFGLLALQVDLIDRRQFVEACTAWSARKQEPLAEVLCARGWITAGDRDDLDRILRRKLERHGGDARRSVASMITGRVGGPPDDEADFEVDTVVSRLSGIARGEGAATVDVVPETRHLLPLVRLHASGGMGRVWVARDPALGREVALKELLPGRESDPSLRARFLREARITGQLEHPNIVPIYQLAHRPDDGRAFYTMRLIRGRRLTDVIRDHHRDRQAGRPGSMALNGLLNAFVAVCNAVAFAHSRHVVHRDLKGQNVVLGDFGEVVVLDWGLAKVLHRPDEASAASTVEVDDGDDLDLTLPGQLQGTPGYMAPEQAEGDGGSIGPVSDVYGLGAILYEILTGRRPYRDSGITEALRRAREEEPPPARQSCPTAPPALEAVCLKAMARRPEDRYDSASELAREVQRWLADEPVSAYRDPPMIRIGRWARRHRTAVAGAASLLLTATLALAIGTALIGRSYRAEADQRRRSDGNFALALEAVDHLFYGVLDDPLLRGPRMERLLLTSSQTALDFYTKLSEARRDDPDMRYRLGLAYQRLAVVTYRQESVSKAIVQCQHAVDILGPLARDHPQSATYRRPLALAHAKLADSYIQVHQMDKAEAAFGRALALARGLADQTGDPADLLLLAEIHGDIGGTLRRAAQDPDGAISEFEYALKICREIPASGPGGSINVDVRYRMATSLASLGHLAHVKGDRTLAAELLEQAKARLDELVVESPTVEHRYQAASVDQSLGKLLARSEKQLDRAKLVFKEALRHWESMAEEYPETPSYRYGLASVSINLGDCENTAIHPQGDPKTARQHYERAIKIWDREADRNPDLPLLVFERARSRYELGQLCLKQKWMKEAGTLMRDAQTIWEGLPKADREDYETVYQPSLKHYLAELEKAPPPPDPDAKDSQGGKRPAP